MANPLYDIAVVVITLGVFTLLVVVSRMRTTTTPSPVEAPLPVDYMGEEITKHDTYVDEAEENNWGHDDYCPLSPCICWEDLPF